jgi:glutaredoxin
MKLSYIAIALMFAVASAHAQLYKYVNPDGSVSYSDTPPPATAAKVERKSYSGSSSGFGDLPYEVAQAAKANPVTLYTMKNCPGCDSGRQLLTTRGVPFVEKTVSTNEDNEKVRAVSGSTQLPVILVGRSKQIGYEPGQWGSMLNAANYPTTNMLPKTYSNPAPEPAAPQAAAKTADAQKKVDDSGLKTVVQPPPAAGNAPPGFQF